MIARVDSRTTTERGQKIELAIDIMHCHLFDKETELTILDGEGTKAYVPEKELERLAAGEAVPGAPVVKEKKPLFGFLKKKKTEEKPAEETTEENKSEDNK